MSSIDSQAGAESHRRDQLIPVEAVASLLGISVRQVWKLRASSVLPDAIKIGTSTRWRESDIQAWIQEQGSRGSQ